MSLGKPAVQLVPLLWLSVLCVLLSPAGAASRGPRGSFHAAARHIISQLAASGGKALRRFASRDGILVVRREVDWNRSGERFRETKMVGPDDLNLGGLDALVWVEVETEFDKSNLTGRRFEDIGARFQRFVHESRRDFQGEDYSLDRPDDWNSRRLGPAASGKLASDEFWYIYFVREKKQWRVYKLELAYH